MFKKLLLLLLILSLSVTAYGQSKSRIMGTVTTPEGYAVPDARVTISSEALIGSLQTSRTNQRGFYRFVYGRDE